MNLDAPTVTPRPYYATVAGAHDSRFLVLFTLARESQSAIASRAQHSGLFVYKIQLYQGFRQERGPGLILNRKLSCCRISIVVLQILSLSGLKSAQLNLLSQIHVIAQRVYDATHCYQVRLG